MSPQHSEVCDVKEGHCLRSYLFTDNDFAAFGKAMRQELINTSFFDNFDSDVGLD